jgi:hypothetical protein
MEHLGKIEIKIYALNVKQFIACQRYLLLEQNGILKAQITGTRRKSTQKHHGRTILP